MRKILLALAFVGLATSAQAQNYAVTVGAGTTFGSKLVGGVNYAQMTVCDPTTPAQCLAVDASGRLTIIPNTAFNVAQINGVTPLMGNGVTGTGSQRVTIASDNTAFSVNATLAAETVKVIGTVNQGTSPWVVSGTVTATPTGTQAVSVASGQIASGGIASGAVASGAIASGAYASGAIGSGAIASGAVASGAYASGSLAVGAGTDGWDATQGAKADAVCGTATGTCSMAALVKFLNTSASTPLDNSSAVINVSTATTTQLVAISASTLVRVTSLSVIANGTGTIKFVYGTGSSCGTGTTDLTGAYPLTAQAGLTLGSGVGTLFKAPAGNALCITTSAAVQMSGHVGYQQF